MATFEALLSSQLLQAGNFIFSEAIAGPDPEHSNTGGHRLSRYDVSGGSHKGGEYERGSPPLI